MMSYFKDWVEPIVFNLLGREITIKYCTKGALGIDVVSEKSGEDIEWDLFTEDQIRRLGEMIDRCRKFKGGQ